MIYSTDAQKADFLASIHPSGTPQTAPSFILDLDGNIGMGYNFVGDNQLELGPDDDPEAQTIPANADIDQLLADGVIEPAIFAQKSLDVRLPKEMVDLINERVAADDKFSIVILTSRGYDDVEFILKTSGVQHPDKVTVVADSGNLVRVGGEQKLLKELNGSEQAFLDGVKTLGQELNQQVRGYLQEQGLEVLDDAHLFVELKGAAINIHWRDLCDKLGILKGSETELGIANIVNGALDQYVGQDQVPKEASGNPVFTLGAGPMTREVKLKNVTKANGIKAIVGAMTQAGRMPDNIVFAGDDCCEKTDEPGMYNADYYAMKYVNDNLANGQVIHTHHPVGETMGGEVPDPNKTAPDNLNIAIQTRNPAETANMVVEAVRAATLGETPGRLAVDAATLGGGRGESDQLAGDDKSNRLIIYSNRPPVNGIEGGAVRVIAASKPDMWIGPSSDPISNEQWEDMGEEERHRLTAHEVKGADGLKVYTFPVSQKLQYSHYNTFANGVIWPIMHSMDPKTFFDMGGTSQDEYYAFPHDAAYIESAYGEYQAFNDLANKAIEQLKEDEHISDDDTLWVHDYQCVNVEGDAFSRHIPFPPLSYLEKVRFGKTPLLETRFFKDYLTHYTEHGILSFQRPVDMANFIETVAVLDDSFKTANPGLVDESGKVTRDFSIGRQSQTPIIAFGNKLSVLTVPVGISQEENLQEALDNEGKLDKTRLSPERLSLTGLIDYTSVPHMIDVGTDDSVSLKSVLGRALDDGHRMFFSVARNDYTKNTVEKLDAVEKYLSAHPEEVGHTHFVFGVAPTRAGVTGFGEYEAQVLQKATALHDQYGDSVIVIPQNIDHGDVMGLFRHENTIGAIGVGLKDGHDLTVREAVDARADKKVPAAAVIMTDGIGASDILGGTPENPGAFVIETTKNGRGSASQYLVDQLARTYEAIVDKVKSFNGRDELETRYDVMAEASKKYSARNFGDTVLEAVKTRKQFAGRENGAGIPR